MLCTAASPRNPQPRAKTRLACKVTIGYSISHSATSILRCDCTTHPQINVETEDRAAAAGKMATMDRKAAAAARRRRKEIEVGNFVSQQRGSRYPEEHSGQWDHNFDENGFPMFPSDVEDLSSSVDPAPIISEWRLNVVALSQKHNLYFAACRDQVHVTIPRDLRQTLPGISDLILELPRSRISFGVGGYIDRQHPHSVNHMIVGDLGDDEILLMACDDGDVLAYYTHTINTEVNGLKPSSEITSRTSTTKPFFHENVGKSAWGLAIHKKSRLIAVSSNLREVTVFVHAISRPDSADPDALQRNEKLAALLDETFKWSIGPTDPHLMHHLNYRRVIRLGLEGHNVPSIAFTDNAHGHAQSILAIDINGVIWVLGIWDCEKRSIPSMHKSTSRSESSMGWGVLSLPLRCFMSTTTPQEAMGMPELRRTFALDDKAHDEKYFDISPSIRTIKDSSAWHPDFLYGIGGPGTKADENSEEISTTALVVEDEENDQSKSTAIFQETEHSSRYASGIVSDNLSQEDSILAMYGSGDRHQIARREELGEMLTMRSGMSATEPRLLRTFMEKKIAETLQRGFATYEREVDTTIQCFQLLVNLPPTMRESIKSLHDLTAMRKQYNEVRWNRFEPVLSRHEAKERSRMFILKDQTAILRTYQHDIELIPPTRYMLKTVCKRVAKQNLPQTHTRFRPYDRLNMLLSIPELSLVITASQAGRAALITLTRPEDSLSMNGPVVMFRVERLLPTKKQEDQGCRPTSALLGIAASPLQGHEGSRARWRLILHYFNHAILSYELSREYGTDKLLVL